MLRKEHIINDLGHLQEFISRLKDNLFDPDGKLIPVNELASRLDYIDDSLAKIENLVELEYD